MTTSPPRPPLFCFGSLMDATVLEIVSGQPADELTMHSATATGYAQREVAEESYPVLIQRADSSAYGLAIYGLTDLAMQRILFFEGEEYQLADINIELENGELCSAQYFDDTGSYSVRNTSWNIEHWRELHRTEFIKQIQPYMELFGKMTAAEADEYWQSSR